jgi:hypothetical protein
MASHTYIIFFSNFCKYSKEVLGQISKQNLSKEFLTICIDSYPNIPQFVDRVPLIYHPHKKEIFVDDNLDNFLRELFKQHNRGLLSYNEASTGSFCFIDDNGLQVCSTTDFMSLGDFEINHIQTPEDSEISNKSKKSDSAILEKYMAQRDDDMRLIKDMTKQ